LRAREERAHQGGLPRAEEAGDDGDRNAPAARVLRPAPERSGSAGGEEVERVVHFVRSPHLAARYARVHPPPTGQGNRMWI
jgi:hypothetical protein